jgi:heptosyltransferase-1
MGDILHALPVVTALRAAHPEWLLGWAVEPQWRGLLAAAGPQSPRARSEAMPLVDQIHTVAAKQWGHQPFRVATLRDLLGCRRELRAAHYDVAVDLQGAVRSAVIARWARPVRLIGEAEPREPVARWWFSEKVRTSGTHVIEQAAEVARAIARDALPLGLPCLPRDAAAEAWCAERVRAQVGDRPFVLLSPGAGWGAKRWPLERYAAVARALAADGWAVVVNASPAEEANGEKLARAGGAVALVPTLSQLIALSRRASLAIAGDTGPLHLAAALGKPTVGIFGPTDPARNGPFHGEHIVLRHPESRRDHTRRAETEAGLLTISPEEVVAAALQLLERAPQLPEATPATPGTALTCTALTGATLTGTTSTGTALTGKASANTSSSRTSAPAGPRGER